ncbi:putative ferric-chelate reductase 1 [Poecilia latipinna]|uniref:putative ferric-chelate reductase 1 n=1 Tax=Poecilia latipinna TaxID=48699 RepID=UPI00072E7C9E|nr:PREDICTED: putative ferric-chelate reductase 1 [Poecilia latipinna]
MEHKMMQAFATLMVFLALSFQPVLSQVVISKTGCGSTKACVQQPDACDPADNTTTCLFGSARPTKLNPPNGVDLAFEISGKSVNSSGFIAVGLTTSQSQNTMLFVCAQNSSNNGSFFSTSTVYNNATKNLNDTVATKAMTDVQNTIAGDNLKCTFNVAGLNTTTDAALRAAADTTYKMVITSGQLIGGVFPAVLSFKVGNATDLSTFLNSTTNTTAAPTGGSYPLYSSAVLPLVSFLTLSILTFA